MRLVVGLGNPGREYQETRHNLGFRVIEELLDNYPDAIKKNQFNCEVFETAQADGKVLLAMPQTMMNLSGESVSRLVHFYKIDLSDLWVIYDDVDLPFGQLRVRRGNSAGGHNGVKSVIGLVGGDFWRFRFGIANAHLSATPTDRFVLGKFEAQERNALPQMIAQTVQIILDELRQTQPKDTTYNLLT